VQLGRAARAAQLLLDEALQRGAALGGTVLAHVLTEAVEGNAVNQLHGDPGQALVRAVGEDLDDARVLEACRDLRLALEARDGFGFVQEVVGEELRATSRPSETCQAR
jgi:hypothetical protein